MNEVNRYDPDIDASGDPTITQVEDGAMVKYEDYAKLNEQVKALAAENIKLRMWIEIDTMQQVDDSQIPATSDIQREIKARGVQMFAEYAWDKSASPGDKYHDAAVKAEQFAAQLRAKPAKDGV